MALKISFFYHPLCPFAQRVLNVIAFKELKVRLTEVDLKEKPSWFLRENPEGFAPVLKVETPGSQVLLRDSIIIAKFLEELEGTRLYPAVDGKVDLLRKALIDLEVKEVVEPIKKQIGKLYYTLKPSEAEVSEFKQAVSMFSEGLFGIREGQVYFNDLMAYPFIERILAFKDLDLPYFKGLELGFLCSFYEKMNELGFVKKNKMPFIRYQNLRKHILAGSYKGLVLPVSYYDSYDQNAVK